MVTITLNVYGKKSFSILTKSVFFLQENGVWVKSIATTTSSNFHEPTLHLHNGVPLKNLKLSLYIAQWRALEKLDIFFIYRSTGNFLRSCLSQNFKFVQISYSYMQLKWFNCKTSKVTNIWVFGVTCRSFLCFGIISFLSTSILCISSILEKRNLIIKSFPS